MRGNGKKKVCYFHGETIGEYYYGPGHPMKPHRLQMTHNLILAYSLYKKMDVYRPHWATDEEMSLFHSPDYVDFIRRVNPDNQHEPQFAKQLQRFTVGEDCPVFDGLYDYCRVYSGGTIDGAMKLNHGIAVRRHARTRNTPRSPERATHDITCGRLRTAPAHQLEWHDCDGVCGRKLGGAL